MSVVLQVVGLVLLGSAVLAMALAALMAVNGRTDRRVLLTGALARDVSSATPASLSALGVISPAVTASALTPEPSDVASRQGRLTDSPL